MEINNLMSTDFQDFSHIKIKDLSVNTNLSKEDSTSIMQWEPTIVFL